LIKFWPSCAPLEGVCSGAKIFGSVLLQPARSVCVSPSAFSFFAYVFIAVRFEVLGDTRFEDTNSSYEVCLYRRTEGHICLLVEPTTVVIVGNYQMVLLLNYIMPQQSLCFSWRPVVRFYLILHVESDRLAFLIRALRVRQSHNFNSRQSGKHSDPFEISEVAFWK